MTASRDASFCRSDRLASQGLGWPKTPAHRTRTQNEDASSKLPGFGQAKSCILLFMYGSPSQLETFDPKPDAPLEVRGELGCIPSSVVGLNVCERLPRLAQVMDKVSLDPIGLASLPDSRCRLCDDRQSTHRTSDGDQSARPQSLAVHRLGGRPRRRPPYGPKIPPTSRPSRGTSYSLGRSAASASVRWRGPAPMAVSWARRMTRRAPSLSDAEPPKPGRRWQKRSGKTPSHIAASRPKAGFNSVRSATLGPELTLDRLAGRKSLLEQIEQFRRDARRTYRSVGDRIAIGRWPTTCWARNDSAKLSTWGRRPSSTRNLYGMTLFGQAALTARRLVEAGGRFITVFWDEFGLAGTGWDTHWDHFPRMKDELLPGLDLTLSGLLIDLDRRGLLDETLVVLLSEHGRTPKLASVQGGGRDHWSRCYSVVMAGGGVKRGFVFGKSDKIASDPLERRVSPKDILATIYHLLGIDPATTLTDQQGRPMVLVPEAEVIAEVLA